MPRPKRVAPPKYADTVLKSAERAKAQGKLCPGSVYVIDVHHDDWCDLPNGRGPCNCNPTVGAPKRVLGAEEN